MDEIVKLFLPDTEQYTAEELSGGLINNTYLITTEAKKIILQEINTKVFSEPEKIIHNINLYQQAFWEKDLSGRWAVPMPVKAQTGEYIVKNDTGVWRALEYIENATAYESIMNPKHAYEVGRALGRFHFIVSGIAGDGVNEILPEFHNTPNYVKKFLASLKATKLSSVDQEVVDFILARQEQSLRLEQARERGDLRWLVTHGDPKAPNILVDDSNMEAVGMIDLDTMQLGLLQYDIGDCLRSGCNQAGEDAPLEEVYFSLELFENIIKGYLLEAGDILSETDYQYIYDAVWTLTFELVVRFFTDYLDGNIYFKEKYAGHNLHRAKVQLTLLRSIEDSREDILNTIQHLQSR